MPPKEPPQIAYADCVQYIRQVAQRLQAEYDLSPDTAGDVAAVPEGTVLDASAREVKASPLEPHRISNAQLYGAGVIAASRHKPTELKDIDGVKIWLRGKPSDVAMVFTTRAALRVVPVLAQRLRRRRSVRRLEKKRILEVFHCVATSWTVAAHPAYGAKLRAPAKSAAAHKSFGPLIEIARLAAESVASPNEANKLARKACENAADVAGALGRKPFDAMVRALVADANALGSGQTILTQGFSPITLAFQQLWPDRVPDWALDEWEEMKTALHSFDENWEVWIDWYEARVAAPSGGQRSRAWDEAFVDIPTVLPWEEGAKAVNTEIAARLARLTAHEPTPTAVPEQSPAPVCVEERDGRIAQVRNRDSPLRAAERDFNAWRDPVVDHIQELLSGDFREGTNHSRARDRLAVLGTLLPGGIEEVKERQFRIGYEIERLEGLVIAYRSGADEMPMLNAATLEDFDRLRVALKMGIDKLERWTEFRREAAVDVKREGNADPNTVADALSSMATEMERRSNYFNPELPASFRFLAEAVKDRVGATKTVIYGAVKSIENLIVYLGQRALGIAKNVVEGVEQHISKGVAASLIAGFSGAALHLSNALPAGWAWLKPLLDALARSVAG
jgi:hypothetical protein